MSYNERMRKYWFSVADNKCQYESYDEEHGFHECGDTAKHIHHIRGEAETLMDGDDPNYNVALPLCERHHVRGREWDREWEDDFCFHPDIGQAYTRYKEWKQAEEHLNAINGRRTIDYSTSPFADVSRDHKEKIREGERYIAGEEAIDLYYMWKMIDLAVRHNALTGDSLPHVKPHLGYMPENKTSWTDIVTGIRVYQYDE